MAINLLKSVQAIVAQIPDLQAVVVRKRTSSDTYGLDVPYESARVQPVQQASGFGAGGAPVETGRVWLFQDQTDLLTVPDADDKIVDAMSRTWLIKTIEFRWYDSTVTGYRIIVCDVTRMV